MIRKFCLSMFVFLVGMMLSIETGFAVDTCCGLTSEGNPYVCGPHPHYPNQYGNCPWYAYYKRPDVSGKAGGNGMNWYYSAIASNLAVGNIPTRGSIAVFDWESPYDNVNYGHVAFVESVNDDGDGNPRNDVFDVTEMGWDSYDCVHNGDYRHDASNEALDDDLDGLLGFIYPVGVYENLTHDDDVLEAFLNKVEEIGIEVLGAPFDNGGTEFLHKIYGSDDDFWVWGQDFYNPDTNEHYLLILNDLEEDGLKVNMLKGAMRYHYLENDGAYNYGVPTIDEEEAYLAESYLTDGSDPIKPNNYNNSSTNLKSIIWQKFKRRRNGEYYDNQRKSLAYDPDTQIVADFPLGRFLIEETCYNPMGGDMIYFADPDDVLGPDGLLSGKYPWPMAGENELPVIYHNEDGKEIPVVTKAGNYIIYIIGVDGTVRVNGLAHEIKEGNCQTLLIEGEPENEPEEPAPTPTIPEPGVLPLEYTFSHMYPCVPVDNWLGGYEHPERQNEFFRSEGIATIYTELMNVNIPGGVRYDVLFYAPDGQFLTQTDYGEVWQEGDIWRFYEKLNISNLTRFGRYRADTYLDGHYLSNTYFTLKVDNPTGLQLAVPAGQNIVSLKLDDSGIPNAVYVFKRDGIFLGQNSQPIFTDNTVEAGTTYHYSAYIEVGTEVSAEIGGLTVTTKYVDTDADGYGDELEILGGSDPIDPEDIPIISEVADVNNDSLPDIVVFGLDGVYAMLNTGNNAFSSLNLLIADFGAVQGWSKTDHIRMIRDINGDGYVDLVGFGSWGVIASLSDQGVFGETQYLVYDFGSEQGWIKTDHIRDIVDINNDGEMDLVGFGNNGVIASIADQGNYGETQYLLYDFGSNQGWSVSDHPRFFGDTNGDGLTDIAGYGNWGVIASLSDGTSFGNTQYIVDDFGSSLGWTTADHRRFMQDINGDGYADFVGFANWGVIVSLSNAGIFTAPQYWLYEFGASEGWDWNVHKVFLSDVNQDNLVDIVVFGNYDVRVALNNGNGFNVSTVWLDDLGYENALSLAVHNIAISDVNQDNLPDIVVYTNTNIWVSVNTGSGFSARSNWQNDFSLNY